MAKLNFQAQDQVYFIGSIVTLTPRLVGDGEGDDRIGEDAEFKGAEQGNSDDEQGHRGQAQVEFPRGFLHVHEDNDPKIIVEGDHAVEDGDDHEGDVAFLDGGTEDLELGDEPGEGRHATQGEHEDSHAEGDHRMLERQARVVFDFQIFFSFTAHEDDDAEGSEDHERVGQHIK